MLISIDLTGRFESAFGFFAKNIIPRVVKVNPFRFQNYNEGDREFEDITLKFEDTELIFAQIPFINRVDKLNIYAPPPILSFSRSKKLIITTLNDDAEVVERWNTGAWDIRMQGLLIDMSEHNYPTKLVNQLHKLFEYNGAVDISGQQLYEKDIAYCYFKDVNIEGVVGYEDTVQYTIEARSMKNVGFTLINP